MRPAIEESLAERTSTASSFSPFRKLESVSVRSGGKNGAWFWNLAFFLDVNVKEAWRMLFIPFICHFLGACVLVSYGRNCNVKIGCHVTFSVERHAKKSHSNRSNISQQFLDIVNSFRR
jgi:hypothetical protein